VNDGEAWRVGDAGLCHLRQCRHQGCRDRLHGVAVEPASDGSKEQGLAVARAASERVAIVWDRRVDPVAEAAVSADLPVMHGQMAADREGMAVRS
jgi:hypothetical protein